MYATDAGFGVVWTTEAPEIDSDFGIAGRLFNLDGVGGSEQVYHSSSGEQSKPDIVFLENTIPIVAWQNTIASSPDSGPSVAVLEQGGYVVALETTNDADGDGTGIRVDIYDDSSSLQNTVQVNTITTGNQSDPQVIGLEDGGFLVVWESENADVDGKAIVGRRFDASGNPYGSSEFVINQNVAGDQLAPEIAQLANGDFVVVYGGADGDDFGPALGLGVFQDRFRFGVSGNEDALIDLELSAFPVDGSESVVSLTISGLPTGAGLTTSALGVGGAVYESGGSVDVLASGLDTTDLHLIAPPDYFGEITLQVSMETSETNGSQSGVVTRNVIVDVLPVPDSVASTSSVGTTDEDNSLTITPANITSVVSDVDSPTLTYSMGPSFDASSMGATPNGANYEWGNDTNSDLITINSAAVTYVSSTGSKFAGLSQAYDFTGTAGGMMPDSSGAFGIDGGFEIWLKPSSLTGKQIVLDRSDSNSGFVLYLENGKAVLEIYTEDSSYGADVEPIRLISDVLDLSDFNQITVGLSDDMDGDTDMFDARLYVNGEMVDQLVDLPIVKKDRNWDTGEAIGIGQFGANTFLTPGDFTNFDGQIARIDVIPDYVGFDEVQARYLNALNELPAMSQIEGSAFVPGDTFTTANNATIAVESNGDLTFDPTTSTILNQLNGSQSATDTFQVTFGSGASSQTVTLSIDVNGVNDAPEPDPVSITAPSVVESITLSGSDVDGTVSKFKITSLPTGGTLYLDAALTTAVTAGAEIDATGESLTLYFDPVSISSGSVATGFNFQAIDAEGLLSTTEFANITVTPAPVPPTTADGNATGNENETVVVTLNGSDSDGTVDNFVIDSLPANGTLYTDAALTNAVVANTDYSATGESLTLYFQPGLDWSGDTNFSFSAKDNEGLTDPTPATFSISINDTPTTNAVSATGDEDDPVVQIVLEGTDTDGTITHFQIESLPNDGLLFLDAGLTSPVTLNSDIAATSEQLTLYFVPNAQWHGTSTFEFVAKDNDGAIDASSATATLTINSVNDAPSVLPASVTGSEDQQVAISLSATDFDGSISSFSLSGLPADGTLYTDAAMTNAVVANTDYAASGNSLTLYFDPDADWNGATNFQFSAKDNEGASSASTATATITITAENDPPTVDPVTVSGSEDQQISLTLSGSDVDGSVSSFSIDGLPANGTLYTDAAMTNAVVANTDYSAAGNSLTLYFQPDADWNGSTNFQYSAKDDGGLASAATATATINVGAVNDPPTVSPVTVSGPEDQQISLTLTGSDVDGSISSFSLTGLPANGTLYTDAAMTNAVVVGTDYSAVGNSLTLYFQPDADWNGSTNFQYSAKDDGGADSSATATATINISAANDVPTVDNVSVLGPEDQQLLVTLSGSDVDGSVASFSLDGLPTNGTLFTDAAMTNAVVANTDYAASGNTLTLYFQPVANWHGVTDFDYSAKDDSGASSAISATTTITISSINDAPEADPVIVSGFEDLTSTITLTGSDVDGSVASFSLGGLPANGTLYTDAGLTTAVTINTDYTATSNELTLYFQPDPDWNGSTNFQYSAKDNEGLASVVAQTVTINIQATPDDVQAVDDAYTTTEDTQLTVGTGNGVLQNDIDPNGLGMTILGISEPTNGHVSMNDDGTFTYTPANGFYGTDSFNYVVGNNDPDLAHVWTLAGNVDDFVGGNDGVKSGGTVVPAPSGSGLQFDGANDFVRVDDVAYGPDFTLTFSFRIDDNSGTDFQYFYSHGTATASNSLNVYLGEAGRGTLANVIKTAIVDSNDPTGTSANNGLNVDISSLIGDSNWHTYTLVVEDGVGSKVFIDGVLEATSTHGADGIDPSGSTYFGTREDMDPDRFFQNTIDSVQLFQRAFSDTEAAQDPLNLSESTVTITVDPVAHDDVFGVERGGTLTVSASDSVKYNDFTPSSLDVTVASGPANGTLSLAPDGTFTYTHDGSATVSDSFVYELRDGGTIVGTATVNIHVDSGGFAASSEFQVNQDTTSHPEIGEQNTEHDGYGVAPIDLAYSNSAVASRENGDYVIVWTSENSSGNQDVLMRMFDFAGNPITEQTLVHSANLFNDRNPSVAMGPDGKYVIVWTRQNGTSIDIHGQKFNADGSADGTEFKVTDDFNGTHVEDFEIGTQSNATVSFNGNGDFVIAWDGEMEQGGSVVSENIFLRKFNADNSIDDVVIVDTHDGNSDSRPSIVLNNSGDTFVVWDDDNSVSGQVVQSDGTLGTSFELPDSLDAFDIRNASVAMNDSGLLAVSYEVKLSAASDRWEARLQVVDPANPVMDFNPVGSPTKTGNQAATDVLFNDDGSLIMTWSSPSATDGADGFDIYGRKFQVLTNAEGNPYVQAVGEEFLISQNNSGIQTGASISGQDSENFVVVWNGQDAANGGIFARQFGNQSTTSVSGEVFEDADINSSKDIGDGGLAGVTVKLYRDEGASGIDSADRLIAVTQTDVNGNYTFDNLHHAESYFVVVDSKTVTPIAGVNNVGGAGEIWAEQTYGDGGAKFGGLQAGVSDDADQLTTAQHVSSVSIPYAASAQVGLDFGFSFDVVTNTLGGDGQDDDLGSTGRSVQGSLRQFISNANEVTGGNRMRFVPGSTTSQSSGSDHWWEIAVSVALPDITDANTEIDGRAYEADGTLRNANTMQFGTPATIGTGADGVVGTADDFVKGTTFDAPELEIHDTGNLARGITVNASDVKIGYVAVHGFGQIGVNSGNIFVEEAGSNVLIRNNIVGASADSFSNPATSTDSMYNIFVDRADNGTIQNNLIGFARSTGIVLTGDVAGTNGADNWVITQNEIRDNGHSDDNGDGINVNFSGSAQISNNLIVGNSGFGIDTFVSSGGNTVTGNTFDSNGNGTEQSGGVALFGSSNTVQNNYFVANNGPGVLVTGEYTDVFAGLVTASTNNLISMNSFEANAGIEIDLLNSNPTQVELEQGDGQNSNTDPDTGVGNNGVNHPVLTDAYIDTNGLTVGGTLDVDFSDTKLEVYLTNSGQASMFLGVINSSSSHTYNAITGVFEAILPEPADGWPSALISGGSISVIRIDDSTNNTSEFSNDTVMSVPPTATDKVRAVSEDLGIVFGWSDFTSDPNVDSVVIESVPDSGQLFLNGVALTDADVPVAVPRSAFDAFQVTFQPGLNEFGDPGDSFNYSAFDFKLADGSLHSLTSAEFMIQVTPVNDRPEITNDVSGTFANPENSVTQIGLTATDVDGDPLTFQLVPSAGTNDNHLFEIDGNRLRLKQAPDFENHLDIDNDGVYEAVVEVSDGNGGTDNKTFQFEVTNANEAPVAEDDTLRRIDEGGRQSWIIVGNDYDPDSNWTRIEIVDGPDFGRARITGGPSFSMAMTRFASRFGTLVYEHDGSENHVDTLTYQITDADGLTDKATITIHITPVEDPTDVVDDVITTIDPVLEVDLDTILRNDIDPDSDASDMTVTITQQPTEGTVTIVNGKLVFTPNNQFDGQAEFQYQVEANGVQSDTALVTVNLPLIAPTTTDDNTNQPEPENNNEDNTDPNNNGFDLIGKDDDEEEEGGQIVIIDKYRMSDIGLNSGRTLVNVTQFAQQTIEIQSDYASATYSSYAARQDKGISLELLGFTVNTRPVQLSELSTGLISDIFWSDLDSAKDNFLVTGLSIGTPFIAASAASFLTVGYVAWVIRGGVLLTTVMTSIPSWSSLDIMSVIEAKDESIEQMVDA